MEQPDPDKERLITELKTLDPEARERVKQNTLTLFRLAESPAPLGPPKLKLIKGGKS